MNLFPKLAVADDGSRKRLVEALMGRAKSKGINVNVTPEAAQYGGGAYFQDSRSVKVSPKSQESEDGPGTLAHELGHAEFDQSVLGRMVQSPLARAAAGMSVSIGAIIALTAEGNLARRLALSTGVVAAGQLPLLTGEGVAWYKGHQMMKEHGASPEQLAHLRSQAVRLGSTYLQPGATGLGGSMLLSAISHAANP